MAESTPAIELVDATKRYGDALALDRVSLQIQPGEFFCLLGPSGCGKTTTLNLIGGFIPLTSGELRIEGHRVNDLPPHKRNVNTVFQSYALFPHMTVAQNVAFGLRMERLSAPETERRVAEYLALVEMSAHAERLPAQLSGGQQQRVALARALAKRPAVLLLDEPLGALDLKLRKQMQVELARIHQQVGTTFVFVTHDQEEAMSMATRIAVMSLGHVVQIGTPEEIYYHPVDRFVADFIGESNFLDGTVEHVGEHPAFVLPSGERLALAPMTGGPGSGPVTLMVRPEVLQVAGSGEAVDGPGLTGRIVNVAFMGNHTRITVATAAGALVVHRPHGAARTSRAELGRPGEEVCVWWSPDLATVMARDNGGESHGPVG